MNKIYEFASQKDWSSLITNYSVKDVCTSFNFNEAMQLAEHLFYDDIQDDANQQFALKLVLEIKNNFKSQWKNDWKNEIFLGDLCDMLWLYDERYLCYKRAYDSLSNPPAELLLLLSGCNSAPGTPPITDDESEFYLREAMKKKVTCEGALMMRYLCERIGNKSQEKYWDQTYKKLKKENAHVDQIIPDVLMK